jgi:integrase
MTTGHLRSRSPGSWELKFDRGRDPVTGARRIQYRTVRGSRRDAQRELRRLLSALDDGSFVEPSKLTVGDYCTSRIAQWRAAGNISQLSCEIYQRLVQDYVVPHIGSVALQKLDPGMIETWHNTLRAKVGARTIGAAHRVLSHALKDGMKHGVLSRNVCTVEAPPKITTTEVQIPSKEEITTLIERLRGHPMFAPAIVALFCGLRRSEILSLRWGVHVDLDAGVIRVREALEETTAHGIVTKPPKSAAGRRDVSLPQIVSDALREHRREQLELRMALGLGRMPDTLVFPAPLSGGFDSPRNFSKRWARAAAAIEMPELTFHR